MWPREQRPGWDQMVRLCGLRPTGIWASGFPSWALIACGNRNDMLDANPVQRARRAPRWFDGIVGSMTRCDGYHAAAAARSTSIAAIGVDGEPNEPVSEGVRELITLPEERPVLERLAHSYPDVAWDRLLFSAKESVYKAWYLWGSKTFHSV